MHGIIRITLATAPRATNTENMKQCVLFAVINKTMAVIS